MARYWRHALLVSGIGWGLACAVLGAGARPVGWVLVGVATASAVAGAFVGWARALDVRTSLGCSVALMLLVWPILASITVLLASWWGWIHWN